MAPALLAWMLTCLAAGPAFTVSFFPGGKGAPSGGCDGTIIVWDLAGATPRRVIQAHRKPVWAVAVTPDGRLGLSAGSDGLARVWHMQSGDRIGLPGEADPGPKPWLESSHPGARMFRKCANCHSHLADVPRRSGPHFA